MANSGSQGGLYGTLWTDRSPPSPSASKTVDNNISTLALCPRWDDGPTPLQSDMQGICSAGPPRLLAESSSLSGLDTEDDDFARAFRAKMPAKLQWRVYKFVFGVPQGTLIQVDKNFKLPSILQVNAETRQKLFSRYMKRNRFRLADPDLLWRFLYHLIGGFQRFDVTIRHVRGRILIDIRRKSRWMSVTAGGPPRPTGVNSSTKSAVPKALKGNESASETPAFGPHL
ncbi:hypothetical protein BST61_g1429 [Cercospora zeina]